MTVVPDRARHHHHRHVRTDRRTGRIARAGAVAVDHARRAGHPSRSPSPVRKRRFFSAICVGSKRRARCRVITSMPGGRGAIRIPTAFRPPPATLRKGEDSMNRLALALFSDGGDDPDGHCRGRGVDDGHLGHRQADHCGRQRRDSVVSIPGYPGGSGGRSPPSPAGARTTPRPDATGARRLGGASSKSGA